MGTQTGQGSSERRATEASTRSARFSLSLCELAPFPPLVLSCIPLCSRILSILFTCRNPQFQNVICFFTFLVTPEAPASPTYFGRRTFRLVRLFPPHSERQSQSTTTGARNLVLSSYVRKGNRLSRVSVERVGTKNLNRCRAQRSAGYGQGGRTKPAAHGSRDRFVPAGSTTAVPRPVRRRPLCPDPTAARRPPADRAV